MVNNSATKLTAETLYATARAGPAPGMVAAATVRRMGDLATPDTALTIWGESV